MRFLLANNAAALRVLNPVASVEAEFGDECVEGSLVTLAHHGARSANPAPCMADVKRVALQDGDSVVVALSHIDLDTLGGCAALLGRGATLAHRGFWALAAFVDVNGVHKVHLSGAGDADQARLAAYHAWSKGFRVFPPRDGSAQDMTDQVFAALAALDRILAGDPELLAAGAKMAADDEALNRGSLRAVLRTPAGIVLVREASTFVNHLYQLPKGMPHFGSPDEVGFAIITRSTLESPPGGGITVSVADPVPGFHVGEFLKGVFGPEAGGHAGIGGSPRGRQESRETLGRVIGAFLLRFFG